MIPFISRAGQAEQAVWIEQLSIALPEEDIVLFSALSDEQKVDCDLAIVANPDPQDLLQLPNLVWVHSVWAGVERMVNELHKPSFSIVRLVDSELANTMSEAVLAWTLFLHRDMPFYAQQQRDKTWHQRPMVRAQERRVGVLGLGELGQVSATRLASNGFTVSGWSRREKMLAGVACYSGEQGLNQMLKQTDILVCLLPLTDQTKGLVNQEKLALLPKGASIINFARGPIIDDMALLAALDSQHVSHAVLDVFSEEPLPSDHDFWGDPNITVLPHISAPTNEVSASHIVAKAIRQYRLNGSMPVSVNLSLGY